MELGYAVKKSRLWENEAFSKNKNYDSGFLPHEQKDRLFFKKLFESYDSSFLILVI